MKKTLLLVSILALFPMWTMASFDKNLSYGMVGPDIYQLQDVLIERGHLNHNSTGYFGLLTLNAVKAFQSANGIPNTGYVGSMTRKALNDILISKLASSTEAQIIEVGTSTQSLNETPANSIACPVGYNCIAVNTPMPEPSVLGASQTSPIFSFTKEEASPEICLYSNVDTLSGEKLYSNRIDGIYSDDGIKIVVGGIELPNTDIKLKQINYQFETTNPDNFYLSEQNGGAIISSRRGRNGSFSVVFPNYKKATSFNPRFFLSEIRNENTINLSITSILDTSNNELLNEPIVFGPIKIIACK